MSQADEKFKAITDKELERHIRIAITPNPVWRNVRYYSNRLRFWLRVLIGKEHICQERGCWAEGLPCRLYDHTEGKDIFYYYCAKHSSKNGFCWLCGECYGGMESFEFSSSGLCFNCKDSVLTDDYEDDYEDDWRDLYDEDLGVDIAE